jgi:hypothetical protein
MKLNQFEAHQVWTTLKSVSDAISGLRAADSGSNLDAIQNLETQAAYLTGRFKARRRIAPLVFPQQLDTLEANLQAVLNSLANAQANIDPTRAQYLEQTQQYVQAALAIVATWGTVSPTVTEERAEIAVVEELQRRNREVDALIKGRIAELEASADAVAQQVATARTVAEKSEANLAALTEEAKKAVEAEKARIATVIDEGQRTITGFEAELQSSLEKWRKELTRGFEGNMKALRDQEQTLLDNSRARYEELKSTIKDYQAIVQADSADRLAKHYEDESTTARKSGWTTTRAGFALLLTASIPLLLVVLQPLFTAWWGWEFKEADWTSIAARAGVSAVLVGAATVAIRMGAGFHRRSDDYKRLAMELRTMGPFLSTVEDSESVDQARLDLVNRTFGQAYAPQQDTKDADAVPVSVLQQLFTMVTKAVK